MVIGDSSDWPLPGWTEDVKISNGRKIKYYTNVETGKKLYSKKEVERYINTKDSSHGVTQITTDQDKNCDEKKVNQVNSQEDKSCSENNVNKIAEGTMKSPEWLPPGWIVELKARKSGSNAGATYKVYTDPSTGNKFYSKPEVTKYLETMKKNNVDEKDQNETGEGSSSNQKASKESKDIGGRSRISKRQKSDRDLPLLGDEGGSVSKKKASRNSEGIVERSSTSKKQKSGIKGPSKKTSPPHGAGEDLLSQEKASPDSKDNGVQSPLSKRKRPDTENPSAKTDCSVEVDCNSVDELPPGWKKEIIIRQTDRGTRKDSVYMDPVHGYLFRSKKDVFRYVETGDTSKCATRPLKRNAGSSIKDNSPVTDDASLKKSGRFVATEQLFATEEPKGGKSSVTSSPAQEVECVKKQPTLCVVADPNTVITSILADINENHFFENVNEDDETELPVSTPPANLPPEPENEQEKHCKSRKSKNTKSLQSGRRVSKRLAAHNPEAAADLDLGEHANAAVIEKPDISGQELLQHTKATPENGNSDQAFLGGEALMDESPPSRKGGTKISKNARGIRKDMELLHHSSPTPGNGNSDQASLSGEAPLDESPPGRKKETKTAKNAGGIRKDPPTTRNTRSKKLECSVNESEPLAAEEKRADIAAEISVDTEPQTRDSTGGTMEVIASKSVEKQKVPENEQEKHINKEMQEQQSRKSKNKKPLTPSRRISKRLVGNIPEPMPDLDLAERALRAVVKKSPSLVTPLKVSATELALNQDPTVANANADEASLSVKVSAPANERAPEVEKEKLLQNKDGNSDEALSAKVSAPADDITPGVDKERLVQNKDSAVGGTGKSDEASPSVEFSAPVHEKEIRVENKDSTVGGTSNSDEKEIRVENKDSTVGETSTSDEKEIHVENKDSTVGGTSNSDEASPIIKARVDEIPPGFEKGSYRQDNDSKDSTVGGPGNSDEVSPSRKAPVLEIPPGFEKQVLLQKKDSSAGGNSLWASPSREEEASLDNIPPGFEEAMLARRQNSTLGTANSNKPSSLSKDDSVNPLPPGWRKEIRVRQNARGIRKDPFYVDPEGEYAFRSRKDVLRYLETGNLGSCVMKPIKWNPDSAVGHTPPLAHDASSEKLACSLFGIQLFAADESKVDSTEKQPCEKLDMEPEIRDSMEDTKSVAAESLDLNKSLAASPSLEFFTEQQLPEKEEEKPTNKKAPVQSREIRNKNSLTPIRRVSKRRSAHNLEEVVPVAGSDLGEGASSGSPLNASGNELSQQTDVATDNADRPSPSEKAGPWEDILKCPSVCNAFEEDKAPEEMTREKREGKRILHCTQQGEVSQLDLEAVKEKPTSELVKHEQSELVNSPREERFVAARSSVGPGIERRDDVNMQWQVSERIGDLNLDPNPPLRQNQTRGMVTENQPDNGKRLQQTQLDPYPFGDYWSDPCMEFAFKTLTGAIPVEEPPLPFQGPTQQDFNNSYHQADEVCFDLPVFDHHNFDMNDVPNNYTSSEQHVSKEQPPITQSFLPTGNNSLPGFSSVGSQNPKPRF